MPKGGRSYESHDFYCINCGGKGIPIARNRSKAKKQFHRKLMYCWHCHHTVNHIECCNDLEKQKFFTDFLNGVYREEANAELLYEKEHPKYQNYLKEVR